MYPLCKIINLPMPWPQSFPWQMSMQSFLLRYSIGPLQPLVSQSCCLGRKWLLGMSNHSFQNGETTCSFKCTSFQTKVHIYSNKLLLIFLVVACTFLSPLQKCLFRKTLFTSRIRSFHFVFATTLRIFQHESKWPRSLCRLNIPWWGEVKCTFQ